MRARGGAWFAPCRVAFVLFQFWQLCGRKKFSLCMHVSQGASRGCTPRSSTRPTCQRSTSGSSTAVRIVQALTKQTGTQHIQVRAQAGYPEATFSGRCTRASFGSTRSRSLHHQAGQTFFVPCRQMLCSRRVTGAVLFKCSYSSGRRGAPEADHLVLCTCPVRTFATRTIRVST